MTDSLNQGPLQWSRTPRDQLILICPKSESLPHRGTQLLGSSNCVTCSEQAPGNKVYSASHWSQALNWQGSFKQCAGPYHLSHMLAGFPIPYLSSQDRSVSKTAVVIHSKKAMTWQRSQDSKRPAPTKHLAQVWVGDSQQLKGALGDFRKPQPAECLNHSTRE